MLVSYNLNRRTHNESYNTYVEFFKATLVQL